MQLRHRLAPLAVLTATALLASGCAALEDDPVTEGTISVTAGFYPLAWTAEQIGGDHVRVTDLTRPGQDAHDAELSLANTAELSSADLVLHSGSFQPSVASSVKANASGAVLDVGDVITYLPVHEHEEDHDDQGHDDEGHGDEGHEDEGHEDEGHEGHDHGDEDPHFWLDPLLMADLGEAVAAELGEIAPEHADEFTRAAEELRDDLTALDREYVERLASCERTTVVVSHDAFGYLRRYGLTFEPVAGLSPGAEPTPAGLRHLAEVIEEEEITTIFTETLAPTKLTEQLAADEGIEVAVLDPVEGLTKAGEGDYFSLMRANLEALRSANQC
ncbi:metal ABC transporter substrate-binding protein [Nocardioides gilvus]|uniref:metal ABC transporter substrate-binding protein n=1 Tax=Nocardioides gilvus TaxID=1735589 RepID=UPI0013A569D8|nr:metal ABC transporter substrate-binding protein [Nocardioides gilvus]